MYLSNIATIPFFGVTKEVMITKVEKTLTKIPGISRVEETHICEISEKRMATTRKRVKYAIGT